MLGKSADSGCPRMLLRLSVPGVDIDPITDPVISIDLGLVALGRLSRLPRLPPVLPLLPLLLLLLLLPLR